MKYYYEIILLFISTTTALESSHTSFNKELELLRFQKYEQTCKVKQLHHELQRLFQTYRKHKKIIKLFEEEDLIESANSFVPLTFLNFLQIQETEKKEAILELEAHQFIEKITGTLDTLRRKFFREQLMLRHIQNSIEFLRLQQQFQHLKCQDWQCFSPEQEEEEEERATSPLKLPNIDQ